VRDSRRALLATLLAGGLWGLSGTAAQALFGHYGFPVLGLVTVRMLIAGTILLAVFGSVHRPAFTGSFLLLAVLGIGGSQLSYLEAIQYSNAVTATLLQFLFLPMVASVEALTGRIVWSSAWSATLALAGAGTFLLVVSPEGSSLGILVTPGGLVFGILSAVAGAYYSLVGGPLAQRHGPWPVTTWGFLIGGIVTFPFGAADLVGYRLPSGIVPALGVLGLVAFIIVAGTLLGYGLFLVGLRHLPATEVGVAASIEPISAGLATYLFLGVSLTALQYGGGALILFAVSLLGLRKARDREPDRASGRPSSPGAG
jgi:drug/metabolite transporter (DMT)-like permease